MSWSAHAVLCVHSYLFALSLISQHDLLFLFGERISLHLLENEFSTSVHHRTPFVEYTFQETRLTVRSIYECVLHHMIWK